MKKSLSFKEIEGITRRVFREFEKHEPRRWGVEATMIELMKQVGDLSKHVMVYEKYYLKKRESMPEYKTTKFELADELADILFCVHRLAEIYEIDLEDAQLVARRREMESLGKTADF